MKLKTGSRKTAIILGAGATRGAVGHVLLNHKRLKAPLNSDFFKVAETYARAKGSTATAKLKRLRHVFKTELPLGGDLTLEQAFSLLYVAKDFPEVFRNRPGRKPVAGNSGEIFDFLDLLFGVLHELDRQADETGYDRLVGALEPGDSILTLNYDTCLDSALHRSGWDPKTGYKLIGGRQKCSWPQIAVTSPDPLKNVSLLKLHGSLNWWVRSTNSKLSDVFSKKPAAVTPPRGNAKAGHLRQIVPPIHGKFFSHEHWQHVWKTAHKTLCEADRLVVVGCSIVDTDFHFQAFLRSVAARRKSSNQFREVVLVDKVLIRRRWKRILRGAAGGAAYRSTFKSLEGFLRNGVQA